MRVVTKSGSDVRMSGDEEESERFFTLFKGSYGESSRRYPYGCVQPYSSSAPEPVSVFSYLAAPKTVDLSRGCYAPAFPEYASNTSAKLEFTSNGGS